MLTQSSEIVMIVPKLPAAIDGLGDYGFQLAQQLEQAYGWKTRFIVGDPGWRSSGASSVSSISARSSEALVTLLPTTDTPILLHYAGHGYAKRGCPLWLVEALTQWCKAGGRLITMFHELYATRPIFSSATLTRHFQKRLAVKLMTLSDRTFTNRQSYAEKIHHLSQKSAIVLPVFSNVGECLYPKPLAARSRTLVIFGSPRSRQEIYQQSRLEQICHRLKIETIIDIGAALSVELNQLGTISVQSLGVLPAEKISAILSDAIAGIVSYPTAFLAKSGIFAAYCSHGVLPIVISSDLNHQDRLEANHHYWWMLSPAPESIQAIATSAHNWYLTHSLQVHAEKFAQCFEMNSVILPNC
ncbi:hypothetical protein [Leptolyngbya sp. NIES-2104]|uniref:hypothetical protein n=1 Tax=Leptolyngbya sp. NIES-2104 TaxID=1552121 RepID=UPI0006EC9A5F|nr:hypothetical protein [Leptolyngbya sp. NIES-2104]GAP95141.1 hypothetical protein NIES2104_16610 [Leptolyngbya sp. NIES-2104]